jgi:hypothetical protein
MITMKTWATSLGKELWITEFGLTLDPSSGNTEADQTAYFTAMVSYCKTNEFNRIFGWACRPGASALSTEYYNILYYSGSGHTADSPRPAFYELTQD